jgi:hypothetical protein
MAAEAGFRKRVAFNNLRRNSRSGPASVSGNGHCLLTFPTGLRGSVPDGVIAFD